MHNFLAKLQQTCIEASYGIQLTTFNEELLLNHIIQYDGYLITTTMWAQTNSYTSRIHSGTVARYSISLVIFSLWTYEALQQRTCYVNNAAQCFWNISHPLLSRSGDNIVQRSYLLLGEWSLFWIARTHTNMHAGRSLGACVAYSVWVWGWVTMMCRKDWLTQAPGFTVYTRQGSVIRLYTNY